MFFMTLAMTELTPLTYRWAYAFGLLSSYIYQFFLNMKLVFTVIDKPLLRIERFVVVAALMMLMNWALVVLSVELLKANYLLSIIVINTILGLLNFRVEEVWVFRKIPRSRHHRIEYRHVRKVRQMIAENHPKTVLKG